MLKKRLTAPFKIVSVSDPALCAFDPNLLSEYAEKRDLSLLDIDPVTGTVNPTGEQVTLFTCLPLKRKWAHLCEIEFKSQAAELVFRHHVIKATNFELKLKDTKSGETIVRESSLDDLPDDVIQEVALVIQQRANGRGSETVPFSVPDTWRRNMVLSQMLPANAVRRETAKKYYLEQETNRENTD